MISGAKEVWKLDHRAAIPRFPSSTTKKEQKKNQNTCRSQNSAQRINSAQTANSAGWHLATNSFHKHMRMILEISPHTFSPSKIFRSGGELAFQ